MGIMERYWPSAHTIKNQNESIDLGGSLYQCTALSVTQFFAEAFRGTFHSLLFVR
jgi:hypothetical protein